MGHSLVPAGLFLTGVVDGWASPWVATVRWVHVALRPCAFGAIGKAKLDFSEEPECGARCRDLSESRPCGKDHLPLGVCVWGGLIPSLNVQSIKKSVLVLPARAVSCQVLGRTQGKGGRRLRHPKSSHTRWKARHIAATHTLEKQRLDNRSHAMMHFCSLVLSLPVSNVGKLSPRSSSAEFERPAPWPAESVSAFPPQNAEGIFHPAIRWTVPWVATGNRLFFKFLCRRSHWIMAS